MVFTRISLLAPRSVAKRGAQERILARHDGDIRASADEPLSFHDLLALLGSEDPADSQRRQDLNACYLSAGEGWREAMKQLGGAFAEIDAGLRERKAD